MVDVIKFANQGLLISIGLENPDIDRLMDRSLNHYIDYADLYFQISHGKDGRWKMALFIWVAVVPTRGVGNSDCARLRQRGSTVYLHDILTLQPQQG